MPRVSSLPYREAEKTCLLGLLACLSLAGLACGPQHIASPSSSSPPVDAQGNIMPTRNATEIRAQLAVAVELAPEDPQAALRLALFDRDHAAISQAEQELKAVRKRFPQNAEASYQLGMLSLNIGHAAEAAPLLLEAAKREQGRAEVQVMAGLACFRLDRYREAEIYARAALKADSNSAGAYLLLARIYSNHGSAAQSRSAIKEYLKRSADPAPGYYLLARMYYRQADAANAERAIQQALQSHQDEGDYWALLGHIYGDLNNGVRLTEAIAGYKKALTEKPADSDVHASLGRALMRTQQWDQAIGELKIAMQNASDPGPLLYSLGQSLLRAGHAEEGHAALAQYQAYQEYVRNSARLKGAIRAKPQDRESRYALIRLCIGYRQYSAARAALDAAGRLGSKEPTWQKLDKEVAAALSQPEAP